MKTDKPLLAFTKHMWPSAKKVWHGIVTLDSWKEAVRRFWLDIFKLDMKKSFSCETCIDLPPTPVFDGIALGVQVEKLKLF